MGESVVVTGNHVVPVLASTISNYLGLVETSFVGDPLFFVSFIWDHGKSAAIKAGAVNSYLHSYSNVVLAFLGWLEPIEIGEEMYVRAY